MSLSPSEQAAELCRAVVLVFRDRGPREARKKARLAFLLEQCGVETFQAEVERALGSSLSRAGIDARHDRGTDHVGIFRQTGQGLNYVGLSVPVGRLTDAQLFEVCRLAERYGTGEESLLQVLRYDPSPVVRGLVSCTGIEFCNLAVIETKKRALDTARSLEQRLGTVKPITIAWSGCPAGCGNHHVADIGLQGTKTRVAGKVVDAVTIFLGGKSGKGARLAEKIMEDVPCDELPMALEQLVRYYPRKSPS